MRRMESNTAKSSDAPDQFGLPLKHRLPAAPAKQTTPCFLIHSSTSAASMSFGLKVVALFERVTWPKESAPGWTLTDAKGIFS